MDVIITRGHCDRLNDGCLESCVQCFSYIHEDNKFTNNTSCISGDGHMDWNRVGKFSLATGRRQQSQNSYRGIADYELLRCQVVYLSPDTEHPFTSMIKTRSAFDSSVKVIRGLVPRIVETKSYLYSSISPPPGKLSLGAAACCLSLGMIVTFSRHEMNTYVPSQRSE